MEEVVIDESSWMAAFEANDGVRVRNYLALKALLPNSTWIWKNKACERSALGWALEFDAFDVVVALLEFGADPNARAVWKSDHSHVFTPLACCIHYNKSEKMIKLLLDNKALPDCSFVFNSEEITPMAYAFQEKAQNFFKALGHLNAGVVNSDERLQQHELGQVDFVDAESVERLHCEPDAKVSVQMIVQAPSTEAELLHLIESSDEPSLAASVFESIRELDVDTFISLLTPVSSVPLVSFLLEDVFRPLSECQGLVKALAGLISSVIIMVEGVRANDKQCRLLAMRLADLEPALNHLNASLAGMAKKVLQSPRMSKDTSSQVRFQLDSLMKPLLSLQVTAQAIENTIVEYGCLVSSALGSI